MESSSFTIIVTIFVAKYGKFSFINIYGDNGGWEKHEIIYLGNESC